jgi:CysZ protein
LTNAINEFVVGFHGFLRGIAWLTKNPKMIVLLIIPWILALVAFGFGLYGFWVYGNPWVTKLLLMWFTSWGEGWVWEVFYVFVKALLWFSVLLFCLVASAAVLGIVSSPIYEIISVKIEREVLGEGKYELPWSAYPKLLVGEVVKAIAVTFIPLVMLIIPGVNILAGVVAAFLMGWDFYDYPLARRGWSIQKRWRFVRSEFWTVLGFGVWLAIPVVQIVFVPMAVAGGTLLNVEALQRRGLAASGNTRLQQKHGGLK